ncbi:retinol dehydrogenase 7-like [Amblyomma americanum]
MVTVSQVTIPAAITLWLLASQSPLLLSAATNVGLALLTLSGAYWFLWHARRALFNGLIDAKGKAVLITGCGRGFGHMLAKQLASDGFFVFAGCSNENSDGAKALKKVENILVLQMDVTKEQEIDRAYQTVEDRLDGKELWAVIANAGIAVMGYIEWQPISRVRSVFDVNTFGALSVSTTFLPLLRKSRGRLVLVSSYYGRLTMPEFVNYCMSKSALTSLADGLRRQYFSRGLHVCIVEPGAYRTDMVNHSRMEQLFDHDLKLLPERVRERVNDKSVANLKHSADVVHTAFMREDLQEAIDPIKMAVRERIPRACYKPGGPLLAVVRWLYNIAPDEVADEVIHEIRRLSMLVKRK